MVLEDPLKGRAVLISECTRDGLLSFPEIRDSYLQLYPAYTPDRVVTDMIKPLICGVRTIAVLGTWCGDSKLNLPGLLKVFDVLKIPENDIRFLCVDGRKTAGPGLIDHLNIEFVPTFIFFRHNRELGRIIERPLISPEEDLLMILNIK